MSRPVVLIASLGLAALVLGPLAWKNLAAPGDALAACRGGAIGGGQIGGPFELLNGQGKTVTDKDVITGPTLVYFGYTFCPDICPMDSARNAEAVELLSKAGIKATPVFISIDPKRDTPEVVADWASRIDDRMIGLTGSPEQVDAASKAYKTYYKANDDGSEYYLVDHSTFTYFVTEKGFVDFFRRDDSAEAIAQRVECFVKAGA